MTDTSNQNGGLRQLIRHNKLLLFAVVVSVLLWFSKTSNIQIDCLGCVSVPAPNVKAGYVERPTETTKESTTSTTTSEGVSTTTNSTTTTTKSGNNNLMDNIPYIDHHKLCKGTLKLPRPPREPPPIPEPIKNDPQAYIKTLERQIALQWTITMEYNILVEESIKRYNLTCK